MNDYEVLIIIALLSLLLIIIVLYAIQGIILTRLNKLMYGEGTPMAWIPFANIYLLGKLTVNKSMGWILIGYLLSTMSLTITYPNTQKVYSLIPPQVKQLTDPIYDITIFILFIYAIYKYFKLKKDKV